MLIQSSVIWRIHHANCICLCASYFSAVSQLHRRRYQGCWACGKFCFSSDPRSTDVSWFLASPFSAFLAISLQGSSFLCERVHACPLQASTPAVEAAASIDEGTKCDFCINVVTSLKQLVASPETEKEFKECLGNACFHIGALKDEVRKWCIN